MSPQPRSFAQVDVFGTGPYLGNPVAVILDAEGLTDEQMQAVARWTNLSETTFVVAPTTANADYRVRIFTPGSELPFAGHPTLGTAHAWLEAGGKPHHSEEIIQECQAGRIVVQRTENGLAFVAPPTVRTGELDDQYLAQLLSAFNVGREQVLAHQWVDNGPGWVVIRLATAQEVLDLQPDLTRVPSAMVGFIGQYPRGHRHAFEMRTFAPGVGVPEDPVCGSMNASVGQWLTRVGAVTDSYRVSQGACVGCAGEVTVRVDAGGTVSVAGATTTLFRGTALI